MDLSLALILGGHAVTTIVLGWAYFERWQIGRPPVGVFSLGDVLVTLGIIVAIPLAYLAVPIWMVTGLLALGALSAVYVAIEPVLRSRALCWIVVVATVAGEGVALSVAGPGNAASFAVNNAVVICGVVGVSNLWVQSGLKARDAAILGGALAGYDLIATSLLPLMSDLFERLVRLPFAPIVGWASVGGGWVGIGLGDLVVATVFPLIMRKAYGRSAGLLAAVSGSLLIVAILSFGAVFEIGIFPVMIVLGPAMIVQYTWWSSRSGPERTTWQYVRDERPAWASPRPPVLG